MIHHAGGSTPVTVDQRINGGQWNSLGEFDLAPGQNHRVTLSAVAGTRSIADSVRFVPVVGGRIVQADAVKIVPNTAEDALYVHTDQLGSPRKLTDASGAVVWDASLTPYGIEDSIAGTETLDARFPGQWYDTESDLNTNYFRDYDPTLGRYLQSDPIGLGGGLNTYAYVGGNPVNYTDPKGLQSVPVPAGPLPLPIPPIAIPGTPENDAWVRDAGRAIQDLQEWLQGLTSPAQPTASGTGLLCKLGPNGLPNVLFNEGKDPDASAGGHRKGARESTRKKHEEGDARRRKDQAGEKGDKRRPYSRSGKRNKSGSS